MDQERHRKLVRQAVEDLNTSVDIIVSLIDESLPECWSNLSVKTQTTRRSKLDHPVDQLAEYQDLSKKLSLEMARLESVVSSLRRRVEAVSHRAKDILRLAAWSPDMVEDHLGGKGGDNA